MALECRVELAALEELLVPPLEPSIPLMDRLIGAARAHLGADMAFLCEFTGDEKIVRRAVGGVHGKPLPPGKRFPLPDTYCHRMVCGRLPNVVTDARHDERVRDLRITRELDIGTYIGVPVTLPDGAHYGTLCCISHDVDPTVHTRDIKFMAVLAELIGAELAQQRGERAQRRERVECIDQLVRQGPSVVFQPIVDLEDGHLVGMEALSRFPMRPSRPPDRWFLDAWELGLGIELELAAIREALAQRPLLPPGAYLSFNASPLALQSPALADLLEREDCAGLLVEVTEHAAVGAYEPLLEAIARLRSLGLRVAVDDFGAGYSSLNHALRLRPNLVKLDLQLTRDIDRDPARQALAEAAVGFAARTGVGIVAEGIETADEAHMLRALGVRYGQGFHFGRPEALAPA